MPHRQAERGQHFYPRPPWGGRLLRRRAYVQLKVFLSTPSVGRATMTKGAALQQFFISIHALRGEGDPRFPRSRRATTYFYPRPPWGGRLKNVGMSANDYMISIHALRGEGDLRHRVNGCRRYVISIHALRGEGDRWSGRLRRYRRYFYPRPPWGGRHQKKVTLSDGRQISIHALRGEGD